MDQILKKIDEMTIEQLQDVMDAIERRYRTAYPEWSVVYIAMHRDPKLRRQEYMETLALIRKEMNWYEDGMSL